MNENEAIGLINHLLDGLHQADLTNFGSHLQIVYVASGGQHVENQINIGKTLPSPPYVEREKGSSNLPEVLDRKNMYRDYYQAQDQRKTLFFQDEIKKVLA